MEEKNKQVSKGLKRTYWWDNINATIKLFYFLSLFNKIFTNVIVRFFLLKQDQMRYN